MHKISVFCVLFLVLMVIGECIELPGGESRSVSGGGSVGVSGQPPVFSYPGGSFSAGKPSKLPSVKIPPTPSPESIEPSENNMYSEKTGAGIMSFTMTSDVAGNGSFAIWSRLERPEYENKAFQLMSAKYGDLTQSRELRFFADRQSNLETNSGTIDYAHAKIDMRDSTIFVGQSYNDITKLKNNNDLVQDDFIRAGAISKNSLYSTQSLKVNIDDEVSTQKLLNNYIVYSIDTRFVGSSNLHAITNNTEIDQFHIGQFALNRSIVSQLRCNNTTVADSWLDCCNPLPAL